MTATFSCHAFHVVAKISSMQLFCRNWGVQPVLVISTVAIHLQVNVNHACIKRADLCHNLVPHIVCVGSEERAKRVSDARSQRSDKYRQDREKQQVMLQLHQQQVRAEAETAALAAAQGHQAVSERRPSPVSDVAEERNLVVVIKADVQVSLLLLAAMASPVAHTSLCCSTSSVRHTWGPHCCVVLAAIHA